MTDDPFPHSAKDYLDIVDDGPALTDIKRLGGGREAMTESGPLDFTFEYMGFLFAAKADKDDQGRDVVHFHANLGRMPYSAERGGHRANALAIVNVASKQLQGRIRVSEQQRIMLYHHSVIEGHLTPAILLTRVVETLLAAKPYLFLLSGSVELPTKPKAFRKPQRSALGQVSTARSSA